MFSLLCITYCFNDSIFSLFQLQCKRRNICLVVWRTKPLKHIIKYSERNSLPFNRFCCSVISTDITWILPVICVKPIIVSATMKKTIYILTKSCKALSIGMKFKNSYCIRIYSLAFCFFFVCKPSVIEGSS